MRVNANPMDARVRRSRRDLMDALEALIQEKNFGDITVKDIVERALVSKNTFYNNYPDKEALLDDLFERHGEELRRSVDPESMIKEGKDIRDIYRKCIALIVDYFYDTPSLSRKIIRNDHSKALYWAFERFIRKTTAKTVKLYADIVDIHLDEDVLTCFYAGGFANLVYFLLSSEQEKDRDFMVESLYEITLPSFAFGRKEKKKGE